MREPRAWLHASWLATGTTFLNLLWLYGAALFVRLADTFDIEPPPVYEPDGIPAGVTPETH
jgi:hypothetical protein